VAFASSIPPIEFNAITLSKTIGKYPKSNVGTNFSKEMKEKG
jgi:hypothetical protein